MPYHFIRPKRGRMSFISQVAYRVGLAVGLDEDVDEATLEILRRTGVRVLAGEVRELLLRAGCWLDGERVRIPSHLIEWALRVAPKRVVMCDRTGAPDPA